MKKYTWEEIKKESGIYKTFCEKGYPALNSQLGCFNFHSRNGRISVLNPDGRREINTGWENETFVKIED